MREKRCRSDPFFDGINLPMIRAWEMIVKPFHPNNFGDRSGRPGPWQIAVPECRESREWSTCQRLVFLFSFEIASTYWYRHFEQAGGLNILALRCREDVGSEQISKGSWWRKGRCPLVRHHTWVTEKSRGSTHLDSIYTDGPVLRHILRKNTSET